MDHREYFNNLATSWDKMCHHEDSKLENIMISLNLQPGCRLLDVGCGTGIFTEYILNHFKEPVEIICVDISEKMIEIAKDKLSRYDNILYLCGDVILINLPNKSIDRIICYSCFPHIHDKHSALLNFKRMLKNDGLLVIAHSDGYKKINEFHSRLEGPVRHDLLPRPEEMRMLLNEAGLIENEILDKQDLYIVSARPNAHK